MSAPTVPGLAVVTIAAGRHDHLAAQRRGLADGTRRPEQHVVVAMGDPVIGSLVAGEPETEVIDVAVGPDGLPLAGARNAGAAAARRLGCTELVFLDVDVIPGPRLVERYAQALATRPGGVLCGPVVYLPPGQHDLVGAGSLAPHAARPAPPDGVEEPVTDPMLFWSLSFATTLGAWDTIGGFHNGYSGYGGEDTDFAMSAIRAGVPLWWVGGAVGYHQHHPVSRPPVEHLADILRNGRTYRDRWGSWPMTGWLQQFEGLGLVEFRDGD